MMGFPTKKVSKSSGLVALVIALLFGHGMIAAVVDSNLRLTTPTWTNGQVQFFLQGAFSSVCVIESSTDLSNWTPVLTNYDSGLTRTITLPASDDAAFYRAAIPLPPVLPYAVAAIENINFNGNGMETDSFDSADPNLSTNGKYDAAKASTNGNIASLEGIISLGSHVINGSVYLAPLATLIYATNTQVLGSVYHNQNLRFPDAALPPGIPIPAPVVNSTNLLTADGYYLIANSLNIDVAAGITVQLEVTTSNFNSNIQIHGGTTNSGTAYFYLTGTNATLSGNKAVDASGQAKNFFVFGLPQLTSLTLSSVIAPSFTGVIYAPSADVSINVGSINNMVGSLTAHSVTVNGHFIFHFDEDLFNTDRLP